MTRWPIGLASLFIAGCHHPPATTPTPIRSMYCWWASQYVAAPPVTLASHFQQALVRAGFADARWVRTADSAWAIGGPTHIEGTPAGVLVSFRMVAFPARDSTSCAWRGMRDATVIKRPAIAESCFHTTVAYFAPASGFAASDDSARAESRVLPICGAVYGPALAESPLLR